MSGIARRRPSPAIIVAVVALVAALAGTAVAGSGAETSKVTRAKVKKIANKQINKRLPWKTADIADDAVTTPKLANGAVVAPKLGTIHTRSITINVPTTEYREATATCQSGEKVLSGGAKWNNTSVGEFEPILESYRDGEGWYVRVQNGFGSDRELTVEAYCLAV